MTKADLVEKVTRLGDLTRRDGEIIVETIFDSVITALQGYPTSNPQRSSATWSTPRRPRRPRKVVAQFHWLASGEFLIDHGSSLWQSVRSLPRSLPASRLTPNPNHTQHPPAAAARAPVGEK